MSDQYCSSCLQPGHRRRTHRDCRDNPRNRNTTTTESTLTVGSIEFTCNCGSTTHRRTTHRECPYNPRNMYTVPTMPATPALLPIPES